MNEYEMSTQLSPVFPIHTRGVPPNPCISHTYEKGGSGGAQADFFGSKEAGRHGRKRFTAEAQRTQRGTEKAKDALGWQLI
jgi:hypothetical protein